MEKDKVDGKLAKAIRDNRPQSELQEAVLHYYPLILDQQGSVPEELYDSYVCNDAYWFHDHVWS